MPKYTFEVTKVIVIDVEADCEGLARQSIEDGSEPDIDGLWARAEPSISLINEAA